MATGSSGSVISVHGGDHNGQGLPTAYTNEPLTAHEDHVT